jgi:hypothetical protein
MTDDETTDGEATEDRSTDDGSTHDATHEETPEAADRHDGRGGGQSRSVIPRWLVPLLIGLVTITAGVVTWRAGQLASSAAFEDRQSVGQTIKQQQQLIEAGLSTVNASVAYVDYSADYAEAAALDDLAEEALQQGNAEIAESLVKSADQQRLTASAKAREVGVFGTESLLTQVVTDSTEPLPFDIMEQLAARQAAVSTGITSPGVLDPDAWATRADDTRTRVRWLRLATVLLLFSVVAYTVAELTSHIRTRRLAFVAGSVIYVVVAATTFVSVF